ncbi:hypothetical protein [Streptomyces sp. NPDC003483]
MTTTELSITRAMSTPVRIALVGAHLPTPVQHALGEVVSTQAELSAAQQVMAGVPREEWGKANERVNAATEAANQALNDFSGVSAASSTATRDSATVSFVAAMGAAAEHLRAALDALADADRAALLAHAVKPGRAVLRYETQAGLDSATHRNLSMLRSDLRDTLSQLPGDIDG